MQHRTPKQSALLVYCDKAANHQSGKAGLNLALSQPCQLTICAGALAGNPFGVDRQFIAKELGFYGGVCPNSMDAVSDRDFVVETLFFCSLHLVHLSRWAEDLIIYSSGAFKYVQCSDAYATGEQHAPLFTCL